METPRKRFEVRWLKNLKRLFPTDPFGTLEKMVGNKRRGRIDQVVSQRTVSVVPVLEKFFDYGNVSAVLRTSEALGYQQVHIIKNPGRGKRSRRVTQGADKWLDIVTWQTTTDCLTELKRKGYQIVVTHLEGSVPIQDIPLERPTAIVFGAELEGASQEALDLADVRCHIPMRGFTQSFNVSVAAGILLYEISRLRDLLPKGHGDLPEPERQLLSRYYYLLSTPLKYRAHRESGV